MPANKASAIAYQTERSPPRRLCSKSSWSWLATASVYSAARCSRASITPACRGTATFPTRRNACRRRRTRAAPRCGLRARTSSSSARDCLGNQRGGVGRRLPFFCSGSWPEEVLYCVQHLLALEERRPRRPIPPPHPRGTPEKRSRRSARVTNIISFPSVSSVR